MRGLVRDQRDSSDTSADVGQYFHDRLKAYGITAAGYYGRADAAPTAPVLASSQGAPLSTTVNRMLLVSDNEIAESLHKPSASPRARARPGPGPARRRRSSSASRA